MSTLRSSGRYFRTARLVELERWNSVNELFDKYDISAVVAKFSVTALLHIGAFSRPSDVDELLKRIAPLPHVVFMSRDLFTGEAVDRAARDAALVFDRESVLRVQEVTIGTTTIRPGDVDRLRVGIERLKSSDLRIVVSANDAEITVAAEQFLHEAERGLLFRAYVPSGRIWESEFDRMIALAAPPHIDGKRKSTLGTRARRRPSGEKPPPSEGLPRNLGDPVVSNMVRARRNRGETHPPRRRASAIRARAEANLHPPFCSRRDCE